MLEAQTPSIFSVAYVHLFSFCSDQLHGTGTHSPKSRLLYAQLPQHKYLHLLFKGCVCDLQSIDVAANHYLLCKDIVELLYPEQRIKSCYL